MAHPKRKISRTRRDKRRTHKKLTAKQLAVCPTTGELHLPHRAFWHEGKLYYKGKVVIEKKYWLKFDLKAVQCSCIAMREHFLLLTTPLSKLLGS